MAGDADRSGSCTAASRWSADPLHRNDLLLLHRTLANVTELLAGELTRPSGTAPEWTAFEWAVARAVAAIHGISPLLAATLRWRQPADWLQFLAQQRTHTAARFGRIEQLLQQLDDAGRRAGVPFTPLKGAALHRCGAYAPGERPMADLDLLVPEAQFPAASRVLNGLGYRERLRTLKHQVFERPGDPSPAALGEHSGNGIKIELHWRIREPLTVHMVDISAIVFAPNARPGLNAYPSRAALLLHLLLHAAGSLTCRELRLLQLHDIGRLAAHMSEADWEEVLGKVPGGGDFWWGYPTLALADRYYGCVHPRVLDRATRDCPWLLRRTYRNRPVAAASLSHLWVSAFPGAAWARPPIALLRYVSARVLPGRETREERRSFASTQPLVSGGSWARLSQRRRMLRWLLAPQGRHETLQPVRAALRSAG